MKLSDPARAALGVVGLALISGCSGASTTTPAGGSALTQATQHRAHPVPLASGRPWTRVGVAVAKQSRIVRGTPTVLVTQSFDEPTTKGWGAKDAACLTAGTPSSPKRSIPACGAAAPQDPPGSGTLQLTPPADSSIGFASYNKALPTAKGLDIVYTLYAFDGTEPGADGTLLYFASSKPKVPAGNGGDLGYIMGAKGKGLKGGYLGVGFDEYGNFSAFLPGGPGVVPETVALGGAESTGYTYLGGVTDGSGEPSSLPFDLDQPNSPTRPATGPTIDVSLTAAGLLEVAIDNHDGQGSVVYLTENIVGVAGQPAVPASVFVGFIGSTGGSYNTHQIANLTISTLQ